MAQKPRRSLVAVMFTDVVGYTAMMQQDEELALNARRRHREALDRIVMEAGGEVLQLFGDGGLSTFPSSVNAVKAATELQRSFQEKPEVPVRIGIHQGDVELDEFGAAGDAVNVASRIESLSPSGGVLISDKVFAEVKNHPDIRTASLGPFRFKNVGEPVELYAVQGRGLPLPEATNLGGPKGKPIGTRAKRLTFLPPLLAGSLLVFATAVLVSTQSAGTSFGVFSYLATWAAFAGGLWFLFDKAEEAVSPTMRRSTSAWLRNVDPVATAARWPSFFAAAFDKLFGEKHWSWRCFGRSAVASLLTVGVLLCLYWSIHGYVGFVSAPLSLRQSLPWIAGWGLLNVIPDFLSLLQTRWVLRRLEAGGRAALVTVDLLITTGIALAGQYLVVPLINVFAPTTSFNEQRVFGWFVDQEYLTLAVSVANYAIGVVTMEVGWPVTPGIFFYSTFLTSAWLWLYLAAGAGVRLAGGFNAGFHLLRAFTDLGEQPFRSLGFAAVLIATIIFLAGIPLIVLI